MILPLRVHPVNIRRAASHAKNLCHNYENTPECKAAWEHVDELTKAYHDDKLKRDLLLNDKNGPSISP
jgi:hypothetical protein